MNAVITALWIWGAGAVLFWGIWKLWYRWTDAPEPARFDLLNPDHDCQWSPQDSVTMTSDDQAALWLIEHGWIEKADFDALAGPAPQDMP